jgi:hypothetical protein
MILRTNQYGIHLEKWVSLYTYTKLIPCFYKDIPVSMILSLAWDFSKLLGRDPIESQRIER